MNVRQGCVKAALFVVSKFLFFHKKAHIFDVQKYKEKSISIYK